MHELPRRGGIAVQGEDEIASLGFCIGAAMTGRRAFTATSGPGISLYSENIGLAIMGEVPLVIVDVQRMGPATGGATTVGQGDVQFLRWGTSGGYPILCPRPARVRPGRAVSLPGVHCRRQRGRDHDGHGRDLSARYVGRSNAPLGPPARGRAARVCVSTVRLSGDRPKCSPQPFWRPAPAALYDLDARRGRVHHQGPRPRRAPQPPPPGQDRGCSAMASPRALSTRRCTWRAQAGPRSRP